MSKFRHAGVSKTTKKIRRLLWMAPKFNFWTFWTGGTGGALFPAATGSSQWPRKWLRQGIFLLIFSSFLQKAHRRMKNVHINVRPHILLPKVVSMKNSHFSTENANVVTWVKRSSGVPTRTLYELYLFVIIKPSRKKSCFC